MVSKTLSFEDCCNYRGCLEIKIEENGQCFWRVGCDVESSQWVEIPRGVFLKLEAFWEQGNGEQGSHDGLAGGDAAVG